MIYYQKMYNFGFPSLGVIEGRLAEQFVHVVDVFLPHSFPMLWVERLSRALTRATVNTIFRPLRKI